MQANFNLDKILEHVVNIVDGVRCGICDQLSGNRQRFACGHNACDDCVASVGFCSLCSPSSQSVCRQDVPLSIRIHNVKQLLHTCQKVFNVNAYMHKRLSEQLQIERDLFPKCIQATRTYHNKRKISNDFKENRDSIYYAGEDTTEINSSKMQNSVEYVQEWLMRNNDYSVKSKRKPFSNINGNHPSSSHNVNKIKKRSDVILSKIKINEENLKPINKKRHYNSSTSLKSGSNCGQEEESFVEECLISSKRLKCKKKQPVNLKTCQKQKLKTKDESGIVIDDDTPIEIDDSQSYSCDKDQLACLAVLNAHTDCNSSTFSDERLNPIENTDIIEPLPTTTDAQKIDVLPHIPFYKKCHLFQSCIDCNKECDNSEQMDSNVSITVENKSFITTITVQNVDIEKKSKVKQSIPVQTDITSFSVPNIVEQGTVDSMNKNLYVLGESSPFNMNKNLGNCEKENKHNIPLRKMVIIQESESDLEESNSLQVKNEVNKSCHHLDCAILTETTQASRPCKARRTTPISTDSSDKENRDPNRMKKISSYKGKKKSKA